MLVAVRTADVATDLLAFIPDSAIFLLDSATFLLASSPEAAAFLLASSADAPIFFKPLNMACLVGRARWWVVVGTQKSAKK